MTALLAVEARRLLSRRLAKLLVVVGLAAVVLVAILVFVNTTDSPAGLSDDSFRARELVAEDDGDPGIISGTAFVPLLFALLLGASLAGAEWRAGTLPVLLTWEPRRTRVLLVKALVAAAAGAAIVVLLEIFLIGALWPSAVFHGTTAGTGGDFWVEVVQELLIAGLAGAFVGIVGFTVAFVGRNTTAALAATFAYLIVVENVIRAFRPGWGRWFVTDNLFVLLLGDADAADADFGGGALEAALLLGVYAAVLLGATLAWFRARDVN